MVAEMTYQVRVADFEQGRRWYEVFLNRAPDFVPHADFVEWEIIPGGWLQVAKGTPAEGSGPLRLEVTSIEKERQRMKEELHIDFFDIYSREGVPVKWVTFTDPWGNRLGFFGNMNEEMQQPKYN
ncbi:VOC family protein [Bacillus sp. FJAT-27986]|uniref:VOC family protein n=1 Tax=Bacillus sp. FJAT-27986 TaxID=1743146 RepID=UPI00080AE9A8|nr:ornithine monooxygenase [Bacillus sp. FJAT-27986]OCA83666.1 ornithine monooxygenase [Bacillus sp. FJAT-27986]